MTIAYPSPPTTAPLPCMAQVSHLKVSARHAPASPAIALRSQSRQTNLRLLLRRPPTAAFPSRHRFICLGSSDSHNHNISDFIDKEDKLPVPIVSINQHLDYKATMVEVRFGHNPNALEDLIIALKDLGLEVVKGSVSTEAALTTARLFVTRLDTGCKVENARLLEMIHLATIDSMQKNQVHALPCQNIGDSHLQDKRFGKGAIITAILFTFLCGLLLLGDSFTWRTFYECPLTAGHKSAAMRSSIIHETFMFPFFISAAIVACLGCLCVPLLRKLKADQIFRREGPASHFSKVGTPTMGGLFFVPVGVGVAACLTGFISMEIYGVAIATLALAVIGLLDDVLTLVRNHNYGLPGRLKLALQVAVGIWFHFWRSSNLSSSYKLTTFVLLPHPLANWNLGGLYLPLTAFCFAAMSNGVNLTDGLDGLAAALGIFGLSMAGACIGFLVHNRHKAAVFMGDTGSLALGGALAAMASYTGLFIPLFIISGIFVVESVSVIIQVLYFKLTKRLHGVGQRWFRMAPIHHHIELLGVKEPSIVAGGYLISCILAIIGGYIGYIST